MSGPFSQRLSSPSKNAHDRSSDSLSCRSAAYQCSGVQLTNAVESKQLLRTIKAVRKMILLSNCQSDAVDRRRSILGIGKMRFMIRPVQLEQQDTRGDDIDSLYMDQLTEGICQRPPDRRSAEERRKDACPLNDLAAGLKPLLEGPNLCKSPRTLLLMESATSLG